MAYEEYTMDVCSQQLSLRYAAPEVLDGNSPHERSDVYALGMLLNEIFSGDVRICIPT
jgi:serine/threonine protein kinase